MISSDIALFFAGLFFANGIPHFVQGISGKEFHTPFLYRFAPSIPTPLFNVAWGLLNFCLVLLILSRVPFDPGVYSNGISFAAGFACASIGLSILFNRPVKSSAEQQ
jgi:hypothetical protein